MKDQIINRKIISIIAEWSVVVGTLIFAATFMFNMQMKRVGMIVFFATTVLDIFVNKRWKGWKWNKSMMIFVAMIAFYTIGWVWCVFDTTEIDRYGGVMEMYLPFAAFGIIGLTGYVSPKLKPQHLAITMGLTALIYSIVLVAQTFIEINGWPPSMRHYQWVFGKMREESHMAFNIYINIAILFLMYAFFNGKKKCKRAMYGVLIFLLYLVVLTSEGRVGFMVGNMLFGGFIVGIIYKWKPLMIIPAVIMGLVAVGLVLSQHERIGNTGDDPRQYMWTSAIEAIKEQNILVGGGVNGGRMAYIEKAMENEGFHKTYLERDSHQLGKTESIYKSHPHNTFINTMLEYGLVGLSLLLFIFIYPLFVVRRKVWIYLAAFIAIFAGQLMLNAFANKGTSPILFCWLLTYWVLWIDPTSDTVS